MRIVMPLFSFNYIDNREYKFINGKYSLKRFVADEEIPSVPGFSEMDVQYMKMENWAIVVENPDMGKYKNEVNMLLITFKIYKFARLIIKYRLCKEDTNICSKILETMKYNPIGNTNCEISYEDLNIIKEGYLKLLEMFGISRRTHNSLYFLYRAFFTEHWIDSFMLLMCSLESLFSKDRPGGVTRTICTRISNFLSPLPCCEYSDVEELYNIRSKMVHGRLEVGDDPDENLVKLHKLEYIVIECFKKMLNEEVYRIYQSNQRKEEYFNNL